MMRQLWMVIVDQLSHDQQAASLVAAAVAWWLLMCMGGELVAVQNVRKGAVLTCHERRSALRKVGGFAPGVFQVTWLRTCRYWGCNDDVAWCGWVL